MPPGAAKFGSHACAPHLALSGRSTAIAVNWKDSTVPLAPRRHGLLPGSERIIPVRQPGRG